MVDPAETQQVVDGIIAACRVKVKRYVVNEVFYSPQGEGARAGSMNVFVRMAGCNLQCVKAEPGRMLTGRDIDAGFNCDTDFRDGEKLEAGEVIDRVRQADESASGCGWVIVTGGEPTLQLDDALVSAFHEAGYKVAVETNGTIDPEAWPSKLVDWISCSPKRGSAVKLKAASEVRVVVDDGAEPDAHGIEATHYFVSPAFKAPKVSGMWGDWRSRGYDSPRPQEPALLWAIEWCKRNPQWRLSVQQHKAWGVR